MKTHIPKIVLFLFIMTIPITSSFSVPLSDKVEQNITAETDYIVLGMGCFWGAEKRMEQIPGVLEVESGYAGGDQPRTGYQQILNFERDLRSGNVSGRNHAEVIKVTFNKEKVDLETVLANFWENHNPTQGDRQGNDIGSNYRSAIYFHDEQQKVIALLSRDRYQNALSQSGYNQITTEILALKNYVTAEEYHQDYLKKNPDGYCGLGGTGVKYPSSSEEKLIDRSQLKATGSSLEPLKGEQLNYSQQLVVFETEHCEYCSLFNDQILSHWQAEIPVVKTLSASTPTGWSLKKSLFAAPTIVLFRNGKEVTRYTGYNGEKSNFWKWLGFQLLSPDQQRIAFEQGTEPPFTATNLDEKRSGKFVDPLTDVTLFLSQTKFDSKSGWPSFTDPIEGTVTFHEDNSHGMQRVEVRSASSGIHLGHVFNDGPPPTHKRYCINGNVLKFIPD